MNAFIRDLSATAEFCLITFLCFGLQTVSAVLAVARHWKRAVPRHVQFGNAGVARVVMLELLCLPAALWIGSVRGWTVATFGLHISWRGTATGSSCSPPCWQGLLFSVRC